MKESYQHVYLSPHYDDASLSCGGSIHQQIRAGQAVLVVTICAAPPQAGDPLSPFARELHSFWGSPEDVVATRRAEDRAAMEALGVSYVQLDFNDCIYRGRPADGIWYYNDDAELFGQIHPADLMLAEQIAAAIDQVVLFAGNSTLYAPLTVGNHVDHQLVHAAAVQLQNETRSLAFYEDYPYVDPGFSHGSKRTRALAETLAHLPYDNLSSQLQMLSEADLLAKISSIAAYGSQIPFLLGGQEEMADKVRTYAELVGNGDLAERLWIAG
jgi:LmbE family N-acetylglucosaminyl deacetylase